MSNQAGGNARLSEVVTTIFDVLPPIFAGGNKGGIQKKPNYINGVTTVTTVTSFSSSFYRNAIIGNFETGGAVVTVVTPRPSLGTITPAHLHHLRNTSPLVQRARAVREGGAQK